MTQSRRSYTLGGIRIGKDALRRRQHSTLRLESLETRALLSADVAVSQDLGSVEAPNAAQDTSAYVGTEAPSGAAEMNTACHGGATQSPAPAITDQVTLMKWDLSGLPAGSTVQSASLTINVTNPTGGTYELHALNRDWQEGSNWRNTGTGSRWQGPGASGSEDRDATVLGTVTTTVQGTAEIQLNEAGIAEVQSWIDDPASNYGFAIQGTGIDAGNGDAETSVRPNLTLDYTSADTTTPPTDSTGDTGEVTPPTDSTGDTGEVTPPTDSTGDTGEVTPPTDSTDDTGEVTPPTDSTGDTGEVTPPSDSTGDSDEATTPPTDPTGDTGEVTPPTDSTTDPCCPCTPPTDSTGDTGETTPPTDSTGDTGEPVTPPTDSTGDTGDAMPPTDSTGDTGEVTPPTDSTGDTGEVTPPTDSTGDTGEVTPPTDSTGDTGEVTPPTDSTGDTGEVTPPTDS
ncbi:MAG: DNRLRE domain-containing protein, partial [Thermoguttaceae bacterium]